MIDYYLHKNHATVRVFVNGVEMHLKSFQKIEDKNIWMRDMAEKLKGSNAYMQVSYHYITRNKAEYAINRAEKRVTKKKRKVLEDFIDFF